MRTRHGDLLDTIRTSGKLPEGDALADAVGGFRDQFNVTEEAAADTRADHTENE